MGSLNKRGVLWALVAAVSLAPALSGFAAPADDAADASEVLAAVEPSLVVVEATLRYDKGEPPRSVGWTYRCPNCGNLHSRSGEPYVKDDRPVELPGYVLDEHHVLIGDMMLHERFVEQIAVVDGEKRIPAEVVKVGVDHKAAILKTAEPLTTAKPMAFNSELDAAHTVSYAEGNGRWQLTLGSVPQAVTVRDGKAFIPAGDSLFVSDAGVPVGMTMNDMLPTDDSWKGDPREVWAWMDAEALAAHEAALAKRLDAALPHVTLHFRSPKASQNSMQYDMYDMEQESPTETFVNGLVLSPESVLVLADLTPSTTARLEKIVLKVGEKTIDAEFVGTLRDYGGLIVKPAEPLAETLAVAEVDVDAIMNRLLLAAEITVQGSERTVHVGHQRIPSVERGWKRMLLPDLLWSNQAQFMFRPDGQLVVAGIGRREKLAEDRRWRDSEVQPMFASYLMEQLSDLPAYVDASNVPLTEEEESRIAWLGVEVQPLDPQLARMNKVSDETSDGQFGALVTHVYADSPAAGVGITPGAILIRIKTAAQPRPVPLRVEEDMWSMRGGFPWPQLSEVTEEYFDQIPQPWAPADNTVNQLLTELGIGESYTLVYAVDGTVKTTELKATQSPRYFATAEKFKSEPIGVTVKQLTFETQRYFRKGPDDPGLLIAQIEKGSLASKAGLKPFEMITHVNSQPVNTVESFEQAVAAGGELKLAVQRMTQSRVVKITLPGAEGEPAPADGADQSPQTDEQAQGDAVPQPAEEVPGG